MSAVIQTPPRASRRAADVAGEPALSRGRGTSEGPVTIRDVGPRGGRSPTWQSDASAVERVERLDAISRQAVRRRARDEAGPGSAIAGRRCRRTSPRAACAGEPAERMPPADLEDGGWRRTRRERRRLLRSRSSKWACWSSAHRDSPPTTRDLGGDAAIVPSRSRPGAAGELAGRSRPHHEKAVRRRADGEQRNRSTAVIPSARLAWRGGPR